MTVVEEELRTRWAADLGTGRAANRALDALCARYREPHRQYHTLVHVLRVLRSIAEIMSEPSTPAPAESIAIRLAGWYHDAIYRPRSSTNEADSAALARRDLSALDQPCERIALVSELIVATTNHDRAGVRDQAAAAILLDADLAILAAEPAVYHAYVEAVRSEYADVDDAAWRSGRSDVLHRLLDRAQLFYTPTMVEREPIARANLTAELARWSRRL